MKKKIFLSAALVVAIALGCYNGFSTTATNENLSDIQLANIEALADGEIVFGDKIPCHSDCKRNSKKGYVDCSTCTRIEGWEGQGTEALCTR